MSGRTTEMGYLVKFKPSEAKEKILAALREAKTNKGQAIKLLDCTYSTLYRWFDELDMRGDVEKLEARAAKEGWAEIGRTGRPPTEPRKKPGAPRKKPATAKQKSVRAARRA